jgi:hypothetical protein
MSFQCPECRGALHITARLELPPDSRSDEITLQIVTCQDCGFAAIAVYEESRRGALDAESVDHRGLRIAAADLRALRAQIRSCPQPGNPRCVCTAHQALGRKDSSGRWAGLAGVELGDWFPMSR